MLTDSSPTPVKELEAKVLDVASTASVEILEGEIKRLLEEVEGKKERLKMLKK